MAFCSQCGGSIAEGAKFCSGCGAAVPQAASGAPLDQAEPATNAPLDPGVRTSEVPDHSEVAQDQGFLKKGLAKAAEVSAERAAKAVESRIDCPHCGGVKTVTVKHVKKKKGFSPGKVAGAFATAGISMLATGLAKKGEVNQLTCSKCSMKWIVE